MDLRESLRVLRKRWVSVTVLTLVGIGCAALITQLSSRVYAARTQLFVATSTPTDSTANQILSGSQFTLQRVSSYTRIATSAQVLQPVIDELGLHATPTDLATQVIADSPLNSVLIDLTVTASSPDAAARICNSIAKQFSKTLETLETPLEGGVSPVKADVVDAATPQPTPVSPRPKVNLALGALVGLVVGFGLALLRETMDTRVKTPDDLQRATNATPLGLVRYDSGASKRRLIALDHASTQAEAFRTIRTNLQFVDVDNSPKVIVITSSVPEEGKTTTACNLAITMAQSGMKVCFVEVDPRRPRASEYLGIDGTVGLSNVLAGQIALAEAMISWNRGMLAVLPSGPVAPNPSELLGSRRMRTIIDELRGSFDMVIIDACPLLPVTDGAVLAAAADGAVLVVRHRRTTREQQDRSVEALGQVDARLLGSVLNFVPVKRGGYGYAYKPTVSQGGDGLSLVK